MPENPALPSAYAPAAILLDDSLNVLKIYGEAGRFMELPPGASNANLMKAAKWGLAGAIRAAINRVKSEGLPVSKGVACEIDGVKREIHIDVVAFPGEREWDRRYLVLFGRPPALDDRRGESAPIKETPPPAAGGEGRPSGQALALREVNEENAAVKEELQASAEELDAVSAELRQRDHNSCTANDDLANFLASCQVPILILDRMMRLRRFTAAAESAFGLKGSDLGKPLASLRLNIEAPRLKDTVRKVAEGRLSGKQFEVLDGRERCHSLWIRPYKTAAGIIDGAVLSMIDITEKRKGILALQASREYAEALVDTVNHSLLILNRHLKVKSASSFYYKLFKDSPAGIKDKSIYELGGGRWNVPPLRKHLSALAANMTPFSGVEAEFEVPMLGRRTLMISGSIVPHDIEGEMNIVLAVEDVSLRKQAAEAAVLRKSEARQRDFVANVSHELMTPITAIKGYSESLVAGALDVPGKRVKFTQIIEKHADRLAQLVEDLLQLSSYDAGRSRLAAEALPLRASVQKLVRSMAPVARSRSVSVRVQIAEKLRVTINRGELNQVIQNLCENAIKYNRKKGRVYIRAHKMGKRAVVSVQDTGIGIPKEDLPLIFDRFHRADNAGPKAARGNGLGLSIVRSILLNHGCRIWAESVEGKGTIIHFTLPLAEKFRR